MIGPAADLVIKTASRSELDHVIDWAAQEGWNPGLADAACFHAADPEGFLIGFIGREPVGCISMVRYGATFGFVGFYIVRPELRGRSYGYRIWRAAMERLEGRAVGLDGVIAQQDNYRKSGFVLAHRNIRFGGTPQCEKPNDPRLTLTLELKDRPALDDRQEQTKNDPQDFGAPVGEATSVEGLALNIPLVRVRARGPSKHHSPAIWNVGGSAALPRFPGHIRTSP